jgi:hypothetical protein
LPFCEGKMFNWFDQAFKEKFYTSIMLTEDLKTNNLVRGEINATMLRALVLPDKLIESFISHYVPDDKVIYASFIDRRNQLRNAALKNESFKEYLMSALASKDLEKYLEYLGDFKLTSKTKLSFLDEVQKEFSKLANSFKPDPLFQSESKIKAVDSAVVSAAQPLESDKLDAGEKAIEGADKEAKRLIKASEERKPITSSQFVELLDSYHKISEDFSNSTYDNLLKSYISKVYDHYKKDLLNKIKEEGAIKTSQDFSGEDPEFVEFGRSVNACNDKEAFSDMLEDLYDTILKKAYATEYKPKPENDDQAINAFIKELNSNPKNHKYNRMIVRILQDTGLFPKNSCKVEESQLAPSEPLASPVREEFSKLAEAQGLEPPPILQSESPLIESKPPVAASAVSSAVSPAVGSPVASSDSEEALDSGTIALQGALKAAERLITASKEGKPITSSQFGKLLASCSVLNETYPDPKYESLFESLTTIMEQVYNNYKTDLLNQIKREEKSCLQKTPQLFISHDKDFTALIKSVGECEDLDAFETMLQELYETILMKAHTECKPQPTNDNEAINSFIIQLNSNLEAHKYNRMIARMLQDFGHFPENSPKVKESPLTLSERLAPPASIPGPGQSY